MSAPPDPMRSAAAELMLAVLACEEAFDELVLGGCLVFPPTDGARRASDRLLYARRQILQARQLAQAVGVLRPPGVAP